MKRLLLVFAFLCTTVSFSFSQQKIDILGAVEKEQQIKLSEIAKSIFTVPLETTKECLLATDLRIHYGTEYIFVCDGRQPGAFYRFTKEGRFLNKIGASGQGPEEYIRSLSFAVDEDKKKFWVIDNWGGKFIIYSYDGKFIRKIPIHKAQVAEVMLRETDIVYANDWFYNGPQTYELLRADRQNGKLIQQMHSSIPEDYKIRLLLHQPLLYNYNNEIYYKNPLKNVICVLRNGLKQYRKYELDIGVADNVNRDDYFNPKNNRNVISISGIYETDSFLLFFYGYKEKACWLVCSKKDWTCKGGNYENCFIDDLSPSEEKFVCRSFNSASNRYLVAIREDKEGDNNPTLVVAELK